MYFTQLAPTARVWVYQANRAFTEQEKGQLPMLLAEFTASWAAHGDKLLADALVIGDYFVALAVDEQVASASGCSIDSSVKFMKEIGSKFAIDFFNRLKVVIEKDGETKQIAFSDLSSHKDWKVYNTLVNNVHSLNNSFLQEVELSDFFVASGN